MVEIRLNIDEGIDRKDLKALRERFLSVNHDRLQRANLILSTRQQTVLRLLPLLLHVNHPLLPGYVSNATPAGISGYKPSRYLVQEAQSLARSFSYKSPRGSDVDFPLHGLFLMGSLGSIAHCENSDMDVWLCHSSDLTQQQRQELRQKCDLLSRWAETLGATVTLFLVEPEQFSQGQVNDGQLSIDDCGGTQHYLLLDEFYRTAIWLAGRTLLWWYVPESEEHRYAEYCATLLEQRFINREDVIDLGGVAHIPAQEFISAGMWQLYKGIDSPYKSLLKLLLIEVYATEHPQVQCLSLSYKRAIYADQLDPNELDAYVMLYRRLETYLLDRNELERLELVRRCLYLKVGKRLTQSQLRRSNNWRRIMLEQLTHTWGWRAVLLSHLDRRHLWKVLQAQSERRLLVRELMYSYRLLTQLGLKVQVEPAVATRDLAVLGRRLYAAFERKVGKVEYLNPSIAPDLSEDVLTLVQCIPDDPEQAYWGLFKGGLLGGEWRDYSPLKRAKDLLAVLAWGYLNGVIDNSTRMSVVAPDSDLTEPELRGILNSFRYVLPLPCADVSEDALLESSYPATVLLLVNVGVDPLPQHSQANTHLVSDYTDALNYSEQGDNLILSIDQVVLNSWNELVVSRFSGEHALLECLSELRTSCAQYSANAQIHVGSFCKNQATLIAKRVEQVVTQVFAHTQDSSDARYLLQIQQQLHVLEWRAGRAAYMSFANQAQLVEYLSQEQAEYIRWRVDQYALQGQALKFILPVGRADTVQVFYRVVLGRAYLYILDERNGLWLHNQPFISEAALLQPLHSFLDSLLYRHNIAESFIAVQSAMTPLSVNYHRIYPDGDASPQSIEQCQPVSAGPEQGFDAVQAIYERDGTLLLYCNHQEFSELQYGAKLYDAVARYLLETNASAERESRRCYITDIDLSKVAGHDSVQTIHFLQRKTALEADLNQALQNHKASLT